MYTSFVDTVLQYLEGQSAKTGLGDLTKAISKIGGGGAHPQNCERDLIRLLDLPLDSQLSCNIFSGACAES